MSDTLPPYDSEAEWRLVASLCEKPEISPHVTDDLFYDPSAKMACQFLRDEIAAGVTELPVIGLGHMWRLQRELAERLTLTLNTYPSPHHWPEWRRDLVVLAWQRKRVALTAELMLAVESRQDDHTISELAGRLQRLNVTVETEQDHAEAVYTAIESEYENPESAWGLRTGLSPFDSMVLGLHRGTFVIIAARPGNGKSSLAMQFADTISENVRAVYYSLEMPRASLLRRIVLGRSGVTGNDIQRQRLTSEQIFSIRRETNRLKTTKLTVVDRLYNLGEILTDLDRQSREGMQVAFVDYLQKVGVDNSREDRFGKVGMVSQSLQLAALRLNIPIVALAQISRSVEKENRPPTLSDLRDSGQIEQDADVVLFLHPDKNDDNEVHPFHFILAKHRQGPVDSKRVGFHRSRCRFVELTYENQTRNPTND